MTRKQRERLYVMAIAHARREDNRLSASTGMKASDRRRVLRDQRREQRRAGGGGMTTEQKIAVLERMRELLADPDRVVLNPEHYFEQDADGTVIRMSITEAHERRDTCRVCFCGAATLACWEILDDAYDPDDQPMTDPDEDVIRPILSDKALALGIEVDEQTRRVWRFAPITDPTMVMTAALKRGRAVEVVDAVLADLRAEVTA